MIPPLLRRLAFAVLLCLALVAGASALDGYEYFITVYDSGIDHYQGFRGDKHGSGRYDSVGPITGAPAWNYSTGDTVYTAPVIGPNGNLVFRGTSGTVYSITPAGTLGWEYSSSGDDYLTGTVAIDTAGSIYFGYSSPSGDPYLCSLTSEGALRWTTFTNYGGLYEQSPVISNGLVYLKPDSSVLAYTCEGGVLAWASPYSGSGGAYDGLGVGTDGTIITVPAHSNRIRSLDLLDGTLRWQTALTYPVDSMLTYYGVPAVSPDTGIIYTPGQLFQRNPYIRYKGIIATDPNGTRLWITEEDPSAAPSLYASPAVGQEAVYSVWDDGSLRAHDLETGEQLWSRPGSFYTPSYNSTIGGRCPVPSPALDSADTVYLGGIDGYFYAIASDGSEKWRYNLGTGHINSATIGNYGTVYVTTLGGTLYASTSSTPTPPTAAFSAAPTSGTAPLTVQFTDTTENTPTSWSWTFGDSNTSTAQSPSHTYAAAGTYTVTLTATNAGGSDAETKTGYITVTAPVLPPVAAFSAAPTSGTAPLTVQFTDASTNAPTAWAWTFGGGGTSAQQHPSHTYDEPGTYTVSLTATNAYGEDTETKTDLITAWPDTFNVATYADLCKVGTGADGWTLDADYLQTADIQCPAGANFPRIGLDPGTLFTGTYDGNGYEIQNLRLHYSDFHTGMFIVIGETGIVQNVTLVDVDVSSASSRTGALAGLVLGTVRNCHSSGTVVGADLTGGLIGVLGEYMGTDVGYLESSSSSCTVTQTGLYSTDQGGLVGSMLSGSMVECSATGDVIDGSVAGGLIGIAEGGTISVSRCSAAGNVTAPDGCWSGTGGLIGKMSGSVSVTDCYAAGGVSAPSLVGGLIGNRVGGTISSCYATGQVAATDEYGTAGGLIGGGGGTSSSFWDTETSGQATSDGGVGKTTAQMQALATFADWDIATPTAYTDEVWYLVPGEDYPRLAWEGVPSVATPPAAPPSSAHSLPYSEQRKDTMGFLLMCWGALPFVGVFCIVIFLVMNGAQRGSGGI